MLEDSNERPVSAPLALVLLTQVSARSVVNQRSRGAGFRSVVADYFFPFDEGSKD